MIYLIKLKGLNYVKVGYTTNPASRLKSYQTDVPPTLIEYFLVKDGSKKDEAEWHNRMERYIIKGSEWAEKVPSRLLNSWKKEFSDATDYTLIDSIYKQSVKMYETDKEIIDLLYARNDRNGLNEKYGKDVADYLWDMASRSLVVKDFEAWYEPKKKSVSFSF